MKRMLVAVAAVLPAGALRAARPTRVPSFITSSVSSISVDYPSQGSLFPADIVAPTFQWRDPDGVRRHGGLRLGSRTAGAASGCGRRARSTSLTGAAALWVANGEQGSDGGAADVRELSFDCARREDDGK
jgi:hypothetical protein